LSQWNALKVSAQRKVDGRGFPPLRNGIGFLVLNPLSDDETQRAGVRSELYDAEAALAEIANLFILGNIVGISQGFKDAIEMGGFPALSVRDRRCKIADRFVADRTKWKIDSGLGSIRFPAAFPES
jgi:hypothetical protein